MNWSEFTYSKRYLRWHRGSKSNGTTCNQIVLVPSPINKCLVVYFYKIIKRNFASLASANWTGQERKFFIVSNCRVLLWAENWTAGQRGWPPELLQLLPRNAFCFWTEFRHCWLFCIPCFCFATGPGRISKLVLVADRYRINCRVLFWAKKLNGRPAWGAGSLLGHCDLDCCGHHSQEGDIVVLFLDSIGSSVQPVWPSVRAKKDGGPQKLGIT